MVHTTICGSGRLVVSSGTVVYPFGVITTGSSTIVHVCKNSSCLQKTVHIWHNNSYACHSRPCFCHSSAGTRKGRQAEQGDRRLHVWFMYQLVHDKCELKQTHHFSITGGKRRQPQESSQAEVPLARRMYVRESAKPSARALTVLTVLPLRCSRPKVNSKGI